MNPTLMNARLTHAEMEEPVITTLEASFATALQVTLEKSVNSTLTNASLTHAEMEEPVITTLGALLATAL